VALQTLAAIACMRRPSNDAQKSVVTLAMSGDAQVRLKAVEVLAGLGTGMTRRALVTLLGDANPEVREQSVTAVGASRVDDAIPKLKELLRDTCETVALKAAGALGLMGDTAGLRLVKSNLKYDGPNTRLAAQMFGEITGHRFAPTREGVKEARRYLKAKQAVYGA
jgi:HEAT repeat protein